MVMRAMFFDTHSMNKMIVSQHLAQRATILLTNGSERFTDLDKLIFPIVV